MGTVVLDLLADAAPNHVAHFITRAREGAYDGTIFHRVIPNGIIQGGDPLSKDPAQSARYGTGGMRELRFERNSEQMTRGAVAAVLAPDMPDSGGSQFFICIFDQPALDGQYTVFARVAEGLNVAQKISQAEADNTIPKRARRHQEGDDPRQAGRRARAVYDGDRRGAVALSRGARDVARQHHVPVLSGQGAEPRAQLPAPGVRRRSTTAPRFTAS